MLGVGGVANDGAGPGLACAVGADIGAGGFGAGRTADFGAGADGTAAGRG